MNRTAKRDPWVVRTRPNPSALLRLFCFPYAGGSGTLFRKWSDYLPRDVEVCGIQFPGRETRLHEPPFTRIDEAVPPLAGVLCAYMDLPFALFGHSLGAFVGFELARLLRKRELPGPVHLFVSGQRAPHLPDPNPPLGHLPDQEFIQAICDRYGSIPRDVRRNTELMQILLVSLRADCRMDETYTYAEEEPLDCPITSFGGTADDIGLKELAAWSEQTRRSFALKMFTGDHFFVISAEASLLRTLSDHLSGSFGHCSQGRLHRQG